MTKVISIILSFFMSFGIFLEFTGSETNEFIAFFSDHCEELREAYYEETGEVWDVQSLESYKEIYNIDDEIYAYLISFNEGYITATEENELLDMDTKITSPLYNLAKKHILSVGAIIIKKMKLSYQIQCLSVMI